MRFLFFFLAFLAAIIGCTSQRDYDELLAATILAVERSAPVEKIVLAPSLTAESRQSAQRIRKVVEQSDVVPINGYDLPTGHFLLRSIVISRGAAHVIGTAGPVPSHASLACGTTYDISFALVGGRWQQGDMELVNC